MRLTSPLMATMIGLASLAPASSNAQQIGESFVKARAHLFANGWQADPRSHLSSGDYMGVDRILVQSGYLEVDYCSVGKSFCTMQYIKDDACLRLQTQGEQIQTMKVEHWSNDCRERGAEEPEQALPADARYLRQWNNDCEQYGVCRGLNAYVLKLKKGIVETQRLC